MIQNCNHFACATHSSPPADWFTPKWVVVLRLHSYIFHPGVKFSLQYNITGLNAHWGDSCQHDILWWYHVNKYWAMRGNQSELALVPVSCKFPLKKFVKRVHSWYSITLDNKIAEFLLVTTAWTEEMQEYAKHIAEWTSFFFGSVWKNKRHLCSNA